MDGMDEPLIPKHGGYRNLKSYQVAQLVFDLTVRFCNKYISRKDRTHDQMVQAARSGYQNIAEGSQVSGTSKKLEMNLTNVARASLEELRGDYEGFLRTRGLPQWDRNDPRRQHLIDSRPKTADDVARWVKDMSGRSGLCGQGGRDNPTATQSMSSTLSTSSTDTLYREYSANAALALIAVACALLDRQLRSLAVTFETEGGFSERLHRHRTNKRSNP